METDKEESREKKRKRGKAVNTIIIIAALAVIAFCLYKIIPLILDYRNSANTYDELSGEVVVNDEEEEEEEEEESWKTVLIDFDSLTAINEDVVGWIRFDDLEELPIDYPILYSGDNSTYLRTDLYMQSVTAGSIFIEGLNSPYFDDYHTIIYGHNMRNETMFGTLKKYRLEEGFWEDHQYFTIYTQEKAMRFQIFSYEHVAADSTIYTVGFSPGDTYQEFIDTLVEGSMYDTGIVPDVEDRIVTLSTCTSAGDDYRFVIHAVCVEEYYYE